jgi:hypothetical protein
VIKIYYAGIGSRETPLEVLNLFNTIGEFLVSKKFILRSGGAKGADKAFEDGCNIVNGLKEIYLPWDRFEGSLSKFIVSNPKAFEIAKKYHPNWDSLSYGAKKLQARNSHQILGNDLNTPSQFVVCWTKNGQGSGGTGQAIRIANDYNIPILDVGMYKNIEDMIMNFKLFMINNKILKEGDFNG